MANMVAYHPFFAVLVFFAALCISQAERTGFSLELIHRDSPKSPFFNPSDTHLQRLNKALKRSINRVNHFKAATSVSRDTIQSNVVSDRGEYLMEISLGTPPFKVLAIADTGSDLIWTQCKPCSNCFEQQSPLFDPGKSSTFHEVSCISAICESVTGSACSLDGKEVCSYTVSYGDRSFTKGVLAKETLRLGSDSGRLVSFPKTVIGCGFNNSGTFDKKASGIIGLGKSTVSLISQLGPSIGGKFSYCLIPESFSDPEKTSKIHFGRNAAVLGPDVVSTPLIFKDAYVYYFLNLEAVSVGQERLEFQSHNSSSDQGVSEEGNVIIDSGTTLMILPDEFYLELESKVSENVRLERVADPQNVLGLCYKTKTDDIGAPDITLHFTGADVKLHNLQSFVRTSDDVICLAFTRAQSFPYGIIGNLAQMNLLVGYDLEKKTVSFKETDCSKQF